MKQLFCLIALLFACAAHAGDGMDQYQFTSLADSQRFHALTSEIRCVVCQNQNIADSGAPLANDLRAKVYEMVQQQKSDEEIKEYMVKRYGEFILLQPRFSQLTVALWLFPFAGLLTVFLALYWFGKRLRA